MKSPNKPDVLEEILLNLTNQVNREYTTSMRIKARDEAKQEILSHYLPKSQVKELVEEIIGEDDIVRARQTGKQGVLALYATNRNMLRAEQRKVLIDKLDLDQTNSLHKVKVLEKDWIPQGKVWLVPPKPQKDKLGEDK